MNKPELVIMAAGLGSRYGKLKQIEPIDEYGHLIIDFSIFDAKLAGFQTVIFVIKPEMEAEFHRVIGDRLSKYIDVRYAHQHINALPEGYIVPDGRIKPWGTAHAVMSAALKVNSSFAVINADDFYGKNSFNLIFNFLLKNKDLNAHGMIGYKIENTLTENGYVSRGICSTSNEGYLNSVVERTHIEKSEKGAFFIEENKQTFIPDGTFVSMNFWGFSSSMMQVIKLGFTDFLNNNLSKNPLGCEYFLPDVVNKLLEGDRISVKVLPTNDTWYGITYQKDKNTIVQAIKKMKSEGLYPERLWENI